MLSKFVHKIFKTDKFLSFLLKKKIIQKLLLKNKEKGSIYSDKLNTFAVFGKLFFLLFSCL